MALPSRMGAFMVGAALGGAQCFYWLREDVKNVGEAMNHKIASIAEQVQEKERKAQLSLAAMESAVPGVKDAISADTIDSKMVS